MNRSLANQLGRALLEGYDATPARARFALDTAALVIDYLRTHPDELAEWFAGADVPCTAPDHPAPFFCRECGERSCCCRCCRCLDGRRP